MDHLVGHALRAACTRQPHRASPGMPTNRFRHRPPPSEIPWPLRSSRIIRSSTCTCTVVDGAAASTHNHNAGPDPTTSSIRTNSSRWSKHRSVDGMAPLLRHSDCNSRIPWPFDRGPRISSNRLKPAGHLRSARLRRHPHANPSRANRINSQPGLGGVSPTPPIGSTPAHRSPPDPTPFCGVAPNHFLGAKRAGPSANGVTRTARRHPCNQRLPFRARHPCPFRKSKVVRQRGFDVVHHRFRGSEAPHSRSPRRPTPMVSMGMHPHCYPRPATQRLGLTAPGRTPIGH